MDVITAILVSTATSGSLLGIFYFVIKRLLTKAIDYEYSKRQKSFEAEVEISAEYGKQVLEMEGSFYPELAELVYRTAKKASSLTASRTVEWDVEGFATRVYVLTENLYKYRVFLPRDVFDLLHEYKRLLQDLRMIVDKATEPNARERGNVSDDYMPTGDLRDAMKRIERKIDSDHRAIVDSIRELLKSRRRLVKESGP